jgi:hypothetical protein
MWDKGQGMTEGHKKQSAPIRFNAVQQSQVPKGRVGKHKRTVDLLLNHLDRLPPGTALKVRLNSLPDTKVNIRAALNRATRQRGVAVSTSSDANHLYIWKTAPNS